MIHFECPRCKVALESPDDKAGAKRNCPQCGQRLQIPPPPPPTNKTILAKPLPAPPHSRPASPPPSVRQVRVDDCPACRRPMTVPESHLGRWVECPHCGTGFAAMAKEEVPPPPGPRPVTKHPRLTRLPAMWWSFVPDATFPC